MLKLLFIVENSNYYVIKLTIFVTSKKTLFFYDVFYKIMQ